MNFINDIEPCTSTRIIRTVEGGIHYEHYRILARRRREQAMAELAGQIATWLRSLVAGSQRRRLVETDWRAAPPRTR